MCETRSEGTRVSANETEVHLSRINYHMWLRYVKVLTDLFHLERASVYFTRSNTYDDDMRLFQ